MEGPCLICRFAVVVDVVVDVGAVADSVIGDVGIVVVCCVVGSIIKYVIVVVVTVVDPTVVVYLCDTM